MRPCKLLSILVVLLLSSAGSPADDVSTVRKAVERSTLNQPGTKPFHLKATLAPRFERDRNSGRTGEVEIWWESPTRWRREVRCPDFHQIAIINGTQEWQKNDGDYFPEWLREAAVELVEPVPDLATALEEVRGAEVRTILGVTHYSWMIMSTNGSVQKGMGAGVDVSINTGLLAGGSGFGWNGWFRDYQNFHNRAVARAIEVGSVTAKIVILEDLKKAPEHLFDEEPRAGDANLIRTVIVEEPSLRKNLLAPESVDWPPIKDGPLEGVLTTQIAVDRTGKVRDVGTIVADNPGVEDVAREAIAAMRFRPFLVNGAPVQVISRFTMSFKTVRPPGVEGFDSARNYFERGRKVGFPAASDKTAPYVMRATFQAKVKSGTVENGLYVDTYKSGTQWRREATIGKTRYVRSRYGDKRYELAEGPDAPLLRVVLQFVEPIPALDTFYEADWRIQRDSVASVNAIRVAAGYEAPDGTPDPEQFRGYWFDEQGNLIKTYVRDLETLRLSFFNFAGFHVARDIRVFHDKKLAMLIHVDDISPAIDLRDELFVLRGHEWTRAFTAEVR